MKFEEKALVFYCQGEPLVGVLHIPENPYKVGLIPIVADAPQYRPGNVRQLLHLARYLAKKGIPVLRFDYRGMGESGGAFPGLEREDDIAAAIAVFIEHVPDVEKIILYGGCDGASAIAIHGWRYPEVVGWIMVNPWVHTEEGHAQVMIKHYYLERLKSRAFWNKVFSLNFDIKESVSSLIKLRKVAKTKKNKLEPEMDPTDVSISFEKRMFAGWEKYSGDVLIIKGDRSIVSKEFDAYVEGSGRRKKLIASNKVEQMVINNADHAFSMPQARNSLFKAIHHWIETKFCV